jgi:hypothetical protein
MGENGTLKMKDDLPAALLPAGDREPVLLMLARTRSILYKLTVSSRMSAPCTSSRLGRSCSSNPTNAPLRPADQRIIRGHQTATAQWPRVRVSNQKRPGRVRTHRKGKSAEQRAGRQEIELEPPRLARQPGRPSGGGRGVSRPGALHESGARWRFRGERFFKAS